MLYHVLGDAELFAEMRRVLAPGGSTVHLLPSPAWRVLATLGHYPYILRKVARPAARRAEPAGGSERSASTPRAHPDLRWFLERARMALVPPPLGPSRHFAAELWQWRRRGLVRLLRSHGFETTAVIPSRLFYTPYEFLGASLALRAREALSSALGSSSVAYVARPRNALDPPAARAAASRPA
jgi:hypothetical protein